PELAFYVMSGDWRAPGRPCPPASLPYRGEPHGFPLYDMRAVDALDGYLQPLRAYAKAQELPADATPAAFGPGQLEVNL
ncbi:glutamine synthetase, partial [Rhizobium ruizarguesonis]